MKTILTVIAGIMICASVASATDQYGVSQDGTFFVSQKLVSLASEGKDCPVTVRALLTRWRDMPMTKVGDGKYYSYKLPPLADGTTRVLLHRQVYCFSVCSGEAFLPEIGYAEGLIDELSIVSNPQGSFNFRTEPVKKAPQ